MTVEFKPYPKTPRLANVLCEITEKIDGTNGCILVDEGYIAAGSRNKLLCERRRAPYSTELSDQTTWHGSDNYGFGQWVMDNAAELSKLGPGLHYGEWWGQGIQRRYGLTEKRFTLFHSGRYMATHGPDLPSCVSLAPVIYSGHYDPNVVPECVERLKLHGSYAAPGFHRPEGVILRMNGMVMKEIFDK